MRLYIVNLVAGKFSAALLLPLWLESICSCQHPVLEHPQCILSLIWATVSHTHTKQQAELWFYVLFSWPVWRSHRRLRSVLIRVVNRQFGFSAATQTLVQKMCRPSMMLVTPCRDSCFSGFSQWILANTAIVNNLGHQNIVQNTRQFMCECVY